MKTIYLPEKPTVLWDKECHFCHFWIKRWQRWTKDNVSYKPFQHSKKEFADVPEENFQEAVCLVEENGEVLKGAEAALKAMVYGGKFKLVYRLYKRSSVFKFISDKSYTFISHHRSFFYKLTVLFLGRD